MTVPMKKISVRLSTDNLQRIATQAHRVNKSVNCFIVESALANVDEAYRTARQQALVEAQTIAVVDALAERLEKSGAAAADRDAALRADVNKGFDALSTWIEKHFASVPATGKKEQAK